jgi:hypothetical protein
MSEITVIGSLIMDNVAKMDKFPQKGKSTIGTNIDLFLRVEEFLAQKEGRR